MEYTSHSAIQTKRIAAKIAQGLKNKQSIVIALTGELGAGKTTFTQGFAEGLGIKDKIISPTFILMRQHKVPNSPKILFHLDLYRLEGEITGKELGLDELFEDGNNIVLIEWAKKVKDRLPKNTVFITIEKLSGMDRKIILN